MAFKEFSFPNNTKIKIYKRKTSRNLRLSVDSHGVVKVSIPTWTPYKLGLEFALSKMDWIEKHQVEESLIINNQAVGKAHHLTFEATKTVSSPTYSIKSGSIVVKFPEAYRYSDKLVQNKAESAAIEALRRQSSNLLPQRLQSLSERLNLPYRNVTVKKMRSRWGSCDNHKDIVLNLYLMILPWHLIDYVLMHELTHTVVLRHGPDFWNEMNKHCPNYKQLRKELRSYSPRIVSTID